MSRRISHLILICLIFVLSSLGNSINSSISDSEYKEKYSDGFSSTNQSSNNSDYEDSDNGGVDDRDDLCSSTNASNAVDTAGCWWGQQDTDSDGLINSNDTCPFYEGNFCDFDLIKTKDPMSFFSSPPGGNNADFSGCSDVEFTKQHMIVSCFHRYDGVSDEYDFPGNYSFGIVYNLTTWEEIEYLPDVGSLFYSYSSELLATTVSLSVGNPNNAFRIYDTTNWSVIYTGNATGRISSIDWSNDGSKLYVGSFEADSFEMIDTSNFSTTIVRINHFPGSGSVANIVESKYRNHLIIGQRGEYQSTTLVIDKNTFDTVANITTGYLYGNSIHISPDGRNFSISQYSGTDQLIIFDDEYRRNTNSIPSEPGNGRVIGNVRFSPDSSRIMAIQSVSVNDSGGHFLYEYDKLVYHNLSTGIIEREILISSNFGNNGYKISDFDIHESGKYLAVLSSRLGGITVFSLPPSSLDNSLEEDTNYTLEEDTDYTQQQLDDVGLESWMLILTVSVLLCSSFVLLHGPTFNLAIGGLKKISYTDELVNLLEISREKVNQKKESLNLSADSIFEIILLPFVLIASVAYIALIVGFYLLMLYLAIAFGAMLLIGSLAGIICFGIPLLFLSMLG